MPRVVEDTGDVEEGDERAVGRPGGEGALSVRAGDLDRFAAAGRDHEEVGDELRVPVVLARRDEGDPLAVRRPRRGHALEVAFGQLNGLGRAVRADHVDLLPAVAGPALVVELEEEASEAVRGPLALVLLVVERIGRPRHEREAGAVGRPGRFAHALLQVREPPRLAAAEREDVELRAVPGAVRDEGQLRPVRRPAGRSVPLLSRGQPSRRRRTVGSSEVDRAPVVVLLLVDPRDHERDRPSVRRDARISRPGELVNVRRNHVRHRIRRIFRPAG